MIMKEWMSVITDGPTKASRSLSIVGFTYSTTNDDAMTTFRVLPLECWLLMNSAKSQDQGHFTVFEIQWSITICGLVGCVAIGKFCRLRWV